jgi:hypothetical protein
LSADLDKEELHELDTKLGSVRTLLFSARPDKNHVRLFLNQIERRLYTHEKSLSLGNPNKNDNSWTQGEHDAEDYKKFFPELDIETDEELIKSVESDKLEDS